MPGNSFDPGQLAELSGKVSAILEDVLGKDMADALIEKTGPVDLSDTRIGRDIMSRNFTSDARADTAVKQAIIACLLDALPPDVFFNPTLYDTDAAIQRVAALLLRKGEGGLEGTDVPLDIDEGTPV